MCWSVTVCPQSLAWLRAHTPQAAMEELKARLLDTMEQRVKRLEEDRERVLKQRTWVWDVRGSIRFLCSVAMGSCAVP